MKPATRAWTTTESDHAAYAWFHGLYNSLIEVGRTGGPKNNGLSVRCVMD
jgi:hypothetical protein